MSFNYLQITDAELAQALTKELAYQRGALSLVGSENHPSPAVLEAMSAPIAARHAEGPLEYRCQGPAATSAAAIERLAAQRACELFGAAHANVQPHSEEQALFAVINILLDPTEQESFLCLSANFDEGANQDGKIPRFVYNPQTGDINYDSFERHVLLRRPKLIAVSASSYFAPINFERLAQIAAKVNARLIADVSTLSGLIAAGVYPNPAPHADATICASHGTLRGPRGAFVLFKSEDVYQAFSGMLSPASQGAANLNTIAAKAVAFTEAATPGFKLYATRVLEAAQAMAEGAQAQGAEIAGSKMGSHQLAINLRAAQSAPNPVKAALEQVGLNANTAVIPAGQALEPTGHLILSAAALVTRGIDIYEARFIGEYAAQLAQAPEDDALKSNLRAKIKEIIKAHPLYPGFDAEN